MNVVDLLLVPIGYHTTVVLTAVACFITISCLLARTRAVNKYLFVDRVFAEHVGKRKRIKKLNH